MYGKRKSKQLVFLLSTWIRKAGLFDLQKVLSPPQLKILALLKQHDISMSIQSKEILYHPPSSMMLLVVVFENLPYFKKY